MLKKLFFIIACAVMVSSTILLPTFAEPTVIKSPNIAVSSKHKTNEIIGLKAAWNALSNGIKNATSADNRSDDNGNSTGDSTNGSSDSSGNGGNNSTTQTTGDHSSGVTNSDDATDGAKSESAENHYDTVVPNTEASTFSGRDVSVLGFVSWDSNVNISDEESLKAGIWTIAANVATDIAVAATYLVLGYVIYGGYLYTFSGGEAGKVENGRKTLARAFLGLAIVLLASLIMNTIRFALLGSQGRLTNCATTSCVDPTSMVTSVINWFTGIAGAVSLIFIVYGGILYITSSGDTGKLEKAKKMITYSLIGLIIVALSVVITAFVTNIIKGGS